MSILHNLIYWNIREAVHDSYGTPKPWNCYLPCLNIFQNPLHYAIISSQLPLFHLQLKAWQIPNVKWNANICALHTEQTWISTCQTSLYNLMLSRLWWGTHIIHIFNRLILRASFLHHYLNSTASWFNSTICFQHSSTASKPHGLHPDCCVQAS